MGWGCCCRRPYFSISSTPQHSLWTWSPLFQLCKYLLSVCKVQGFVVGLLYIDKQSSQTSCPWGSNTVKRDTDDESKTINKHECMLGGRNCPPLFSFPKQFWLFGIIIIPTSSFPLTLLTWAVFSHRRGSEWVLKGKQALGFSGCSDWISPLGGKKCEELKRSLQRGRWQRKSYRSITAKFNLIFTLQVTSLLLFVWRPYNQVD